MPPHLIGEMMDVDDPELDFGGRQSIERMIDQGLAADLDQRLGHALGERPHADAETGGQHHGAARPERRMRIRHAAVSEAPGGRESRNTNRGPKLANRPGGSRAAGPQSPTQAELTRVPGYCPRTRLLARPSSDGRASGSDIGIPAAGDANIAACRRGGRAARRALRSWWRAALPAWRRAPRTRQPGNRDRRPGGPGHSRRAAPSPAARGRRPGHPGAAIPGRRRAARAERPRNRAGPREPCLVAAEATAGWGNDSRAAPRSAAPRWHAAAMRATTPGARIAPAGRRRRLDAARTSRAAIPPRSGTRPDRTPAEDDRAAARPAAPPAAPADAARPARRQPWRSVPGSARRYRSPPRLRCRDPRGQAALRQGRRRRFRVRKTRVRAARAPSRRTASRPRRDARSRYRACRRAAPARPAGVARSSGWRCRRP